MSSEMYGAANLSNQGPTLSVPLALLVSMAESTCSFKSFSFSIGLVLNIVFSDYGKFIQSVLKMNNCFVSVNDFLNTHCS